MMENKLKPIDALRREKHKLNIECRASEERLLDSWLYLNENMGSLLFNSAVDSVRRKLGFGGGRESEKQERIASTPHSSGGIMHNLATGALLVAPMLWELAQPMLISAAISKVKSIFTRKKKKKK